MLVIVPKGRKLIRNGVTNLHYDRVGQSNTTGFWTSTDSLRLGSMASEACLSLEVVLGRRVSRNLIGNLSACVVSL
jgi:hypothetical protein